MKSTFQYDVFYDEFFCDCFADLEKAIKFIQEAYKNNIDLRESACNYKIKIGSFLIAEY